MKGFKFIALTAEEKLKQIKQSSKKHIVKSQKKISETESSYSEDSDHDSNPNSETISPVRAHQ